MTTRKLCMIVPVLLLGVAMALAADEQEPTAEEPTSEEPTTEEPTTEELMTDAQARGYQAVTEDDSEAAAGWFQKAADYADRIASWEGLMDASLALSSIGDIDASKAILDRAKTLSDTFKDWRTSLAMGHAYASLPDEAEADDQAKTAIDDAEAQAEQLESWRAMAEVGTAYLGLKLDEAKEHATDAFTSAVALVDKAPDPEGYTVLAQRFEEVGDDAKADELREKAEQLPPKKRKARPAPPPGWSPTGRSLAEPREISEESKAILAQKAAQKHAEATAAALKRGSIDDQEAYVYEYSRYWVSHPGRFRFRVWRHGVDFDTRAWATHHLGGYRFVNGRYIRVVVGD